ncbi:MULTISPECIES: hypothetical protein [Prevotellaceae]|uniref:hypothetical protein n=1 Tax=Prevotellaceae TaxID=171552 RepID=UPI0011C1C09F|nr:MULTISPECIES: hypothetical protein [Prevotellaceae]
MVKIIEDKYRWQNRYYKIHKHLKDFANWLMIFRHRGQQEWIRIYKAGKAYSVSYDSRKAKELYLKRLIDLCKYSIFQQDKELFSTIMLRVQELTKCEKDKDLSFRRGQLMSTGAAHYFTCKFYKTIFEYYSSCSNFTYCESYLVWGCLSAYSRCKFLYVVDIVQMTQCMFYLAKGGKYTLIKELLEKTDWHFRSIMDMPKVFYVEGYLPDNREKIDKLSLENWNELSNYMFLFSSYCLRNKHYDVLRGILSKIHWAGSMFPSNKFDVIYRYLMCLKEVHDDDRFGVFWGHELCDDLIVDRALLREYCAFLILVFHRCSSESYGNISMELLKMLVDEYVYLERSVLDLRKDDELCKLFPEINQTDFSEVYREVFSDAALGREILRNTSSDIRCESQFPTFMHWYLSESICKIDNKRKMIDDEFFAEIPDESIVYFRRSLLEAKKHLVQRLPLKVQVPASLNAEDYKMMTVNPCQFLFDKRYFLTCDLTILGYLKPIVDIMYCRINYMLLNAIKEMKIKNVKIKIADFHNYLIKITKGRFEEYILLDINSQFQAFLKLKHKGYQNLDYFGMKYVPIESIDNRYLEDLPIMNDFCNSMLIMKKSELPVLMDRLDDVDVKIKDESSVKDGKLDIRTTFDYGYELWYRRNVNVFHILPQRTLV